MKNLINSSLALGLIFMTYLYMNSLSSSDPVSAKKVESNKSKSILVNKNIETSKLEKISKHEHHDKKPHEHNETINEENLDTDKHSHIPQDIRERLCLPTSQKNTCELSLKYNLESVLLSDEGNQLTSEINVTLSSDNFEAMLEQLTLSKTTEQAYERESNYNNQMVDILSNIQAYPQIIWLVVIKFVLPASLIKIKNHGKILTNNSLVTILKKVTYLLLTWTIKRIQIPKSGLCSFLEIMVQYLKE